jgi:hydroxymethylbilane synthase
MGKLDKGDYAAIILAAAGLRRLGLGQRIRRYLSPEESLPAAGQGALGIEILERRGDVGAWLAPLNCPDTTACTLAERAVSRVLGGSCQVPLAALAEVSGSTLMLRALVAEPDGLHIIRAQASGPVEEPVRLGEQVGKELLDKGAAAILAKLTASASAE